MQQAVVLVLLLCPCSPQNMLSSRLVMLPGRGAFLGAGDAEGQDVPPCHETIAELHASGATYTELSGAAPRDPAAARTEAAAVSDRTTADVSHVSTAVAAAAAAAPIEAALREQTVMQPQSENSNGGSEAAAASKCVPNPFYTRMLHPPVLPSSDDDFCLLTAKCRLWQGASSGGRKDSREIPGA